MLCLPCRASRAWPAICPHDVTGCDPSTDVSDLTDRSWWPQSDGWPGRATKECGSLGQPETGLFPGRSHREQVAPPPPGRHWRRLCLFLGASDQPESPCLTTDGQATGLWRSASANWMGGARDPLRLASGNEQMPAFVRPPCALRHARRLAMRTCLAYLLASWHNDNNRIAKLGRPLSLLAVYQCRGNTGGAPGGGPKRIGHDPPLSTCPSPKPARFDKLSLRTNATATPRLWGVSPRAHPHPSSARWNRAQALGLGRTGS